MQPTIEVLAKVKQNSLKNKEEVFTRLYRYLLRPDIYYAAYKKLYSNNGAATKGVNNDTADGFSESKVNAIIKSLTENTYTPNSTRRVYIVKANGKLRPLGIPTFTDKLIQEVLRMILEAVYEPVFLEYSHGFRPNRGCHTALKDVKHQFHGARWFIEGDIKGCFDNIDHNALIGFINAKIKDARFLQLIWKFLKAGYLDNWKYNATYSGTPQGGIVSPILANIYLHELDKFVEKLKADFDKPNPPKSCTAEYVAQHRQMGYIRQKIGRKRNAGKKKELLLELKEAKKALLKIPAKLQTDKQIKYIRYADDFIIGVNGDKADCERIKSELKFFIGDKLKMELSEEKTLIKHSNEYARFLGYDIRVRRDTQVRADKNGVTKRTLSNMTELNIPLQDKIERFLFREKAVEQTNSGLFPRERRNLIRLTDLEIVATYNAELRGICNYYSMASNFARLDYFAYLMEYSCLKTLAGKHKSHISEIRETYKDKKGGWCIPYKTKKGIKQMYFAKYQDCKSDPILSDIKTKQPLMHLYNTTTFEHRLKAKVCEICGSESAKSYEIHHVNKVKNLKGKERWERIMIAKRRKTIVTCEECHHKIHGKKS